MDRTEHLRLRAEFAALRFQLALLRLDGIERKYRDDQPCVPAGSPEGGRWTDDGISGTASASDPLPLDDGVFRPAEDGTPTTEPIVAAKPPLVDVRREDQQGGHTVDHGHVAVPNGALMKMLQSERLDTPGLSVYVTAHGSYNDMDAANRYTNDVLQSYPDKVAAVASGVERSDFLEKRYSSPTGREAYRMSETENPAISVRPTYSAGVAIKHTGTGKGFVVITSFPKN